jgi:predicted permease
VDGALVTASVFEVLRVPALMGRVLLPGDEDTGAEDVVVVGQDVWESRLGSDPDVIGRVIRVGGVDRTVVGVMPASFRFPLNDLVWLPLRPTSGADRVEDPEQLQDWPAVVVFGRLADGVSDDEARAEAAALGASPRPEQVPFGSSSVVVTSFWVAMMGDVRGDSEFVVVQLLALLVLVIACANVAMLIFARTVRRSMELAVRTALGASRARIISQLFVEALLLAVLAAGTGLFIGDQILLRILEAPFEAVGWPAWLDLGVRKGTVVQALALAAVSAVLAGVVPALRVTGKSLQPTLQRAAAGRPGLRFGGVSSALIVGDVTIAVVAACFAIIFAPRDDGLEDGTEGWSESFLSAELTVPSAEGVRSSGPAAMARVAATQEELLRRLRAEPGVRAVAVASALPGMDHDGARVEVAEPGNEPSAGHLAAAVSVEPGFFETIGHPVLSGRDFDQADLVEGTAVIVNTDFVENVLDGRNPVGRQMRIVTGREQTPGPWLEIVGVVGRLGTINSYSDFETFEAFYRPASVGQINPAWLAIALDGDPGAFTSRLRQLAIEVDPSAVIDQPMPLNEVQSFAEFGRRMMVLAGTLLVGILVGLAASGTYALMSFTVTQRTREIGIRTALGAQRVGIALAIGRRALAQLAVGGVLGMVLGLVLLEEVLPTGVAYLFALALGPGLMVVIGLLACTGPTLRALRIAPTQALKAEG